MKDNDGQIFPVAKLKRYQQRSLSIRTRVYWFSNKFRTSLRESFEVNCKKFVSPKPQFGLFMRIFDKSPIWWRDYQRKLFREIKETLNKLKILLNNTCVAFLFICIELWPAPKYKQKDWQMVCADLSEVQRIMHKKFPATVMVLEVYSIETCDTNALLSTRTNK